MAKRTWALPDIQELSKEQERARLLPMEGCHLIVGGPGTGKSVLALLRTRRHHRPKGGQDYVFLVYNKLLLEASRELVDNAVNAHPWKAWFKGMYKRMLAQPCPVRNGKAYDIDWEQVEAGIDSVPQEIPPPLTPFVIIDEGQDMPPAFYDALAQLSFKNAYVVADQNQQITDENSNLRDIKNFTGNRVELTENYRNCDRVARLALEFCVEDLATPPVSLPTNKPCARTPVLVDYGPGCRWDFDGVVQRLLKLTDRNPDKLIGVITPKNTCRDRWLEGLRGALKDKKVALDHGRPRVVTYASGDEDGDHRFSQGGIFVINAQSAKGLEFDWVFLADIDEYVCHLADQVWMDEKKRLFYVMVSRAREQVILLRRSDRACPIEAILPKDESILRHWR